MTGVAGPRPLLHRTVLVTALLGAVWLGFAGWSAWSGARKLAAAGLTGETGRLHVEVTLDFPPEAFHMTYFQALGRLIEVRGRTVYLMDVDAADVRGLARRYWVEAVRPWRGI
jgi:hypothetical protein